MNNKKDGFTLVEILAVISIVGLLALIAIPNVLKSLKDTKEDLYQTQIKLIKSSAATYVTDAVAHPNINTAIQNLVKYKGGKTTITLGDLQNNGSADINLSNPLCEGKDKYFDPNIAIEITYDGKEFDYEIITPDADLRISCVAER